MKSGTCVQEIKREEKREGRLGKTNITEKERINLGIRDLLRINTK